MASPGGGDGATDADFGSLGRSAGRAFGATRRLTVRGSRGDAAGDAATAGRPGRAVPRQSRGRRPRPRGARQEGPARHRPPARRGRGARGRRAAEAHELPRARGPGCRHERRSRSRHAGHRHAGHRHAGSRHARSRHTGDRLGSKPGPGPAAGGPRLRPAQLRRPPTRAGRRRGVRAQVRLAADGRDRGADRRGSHPGARRHQRPGGGEGSGAQGHSGRRRQPDREGRADRPRQQLLGAAALALRGRGGGRATSRSPTASPS